MNDTIYSIIGDVPVSEQIAVALEHTALKDHVHKGYAAQSDVDDLKRKIEVLMNLVGDTPVVDQINLALKNIK